ncbi:DUF411 domain-containing protein [Ramlibacter sp. RBP-2]|uniref:DUF411 domain-containing protein n=1 Tax=Ramlibacter lithotrophicus TaxID=2606681 RepID=A0A7X6DHY1_9BURK|nr:DUF411 domain-containing protein [Ramlibacter lithotrophicus]NKE67470.1 DUF411 domain-containing protein [Ramlibacter lithotrophicus]
MTETTTPLASRRRLLLAMGLLPLAGAVHAAAPAAALPPVEVWKEPTCGCCKDWIAHMEANGFKVFVNTGGTQAAKQRLGIPQDMGSCHTAKVGGYALEGHVPAKDIKRLLKEKPNAVGLAAPGMPIGSPGMDTPAYNGKKNPYNVMLIAKNGKHTVYQKYEGNNL